MSDRREQIVEAALAVAQSQGLAAMTMRAVAAQVGCSVMALYRYVPTKDALLDELVGRLLAEVDLPDPGQPWQTRLHHLARQVYELAGRYPTVVPLLMTRAYVAADAVHVVGTTTAILVEAGVPVDQVPRLERMISTYLLGYATSAANSAFWSDPNASSPPAAPTPRQTGAPPPSSESRDHWRSELDRDISDLADLLNHLAQRSR